MGVQMSYVHIYAAAAQPMIRHRADLWFDDVGKWYEYNPRRQFRCCTCGQLRYAKNLVIRVYYDGSYIFCAEGHKHPNGDMRRKVVPARERRN